MPLKRYGIDCRNYTPIKDSRPIATGGINRAGNRFRVLNCLIFRMLRPELKISTPPTRCRGQYNRGDAVQDCIGKKVGVISVQSTFNGAQNGQRTCTI